MTVIVVTPPDAAPVSLDEAKAHLRVDDDDSNDLITALVNVATATLDGPQSTLGRALMTQTLAMRLDGFPWSLGSLDIWDRRKFRGLDCWPHRFGNFNWREIPLPYPPFAGSVAITYQDADNVQQTLDPSVYRVIGGGHAISKISLAYNQSWPAALYEEESVTVQWQAGYGTDPSSVPAPLRHAILLIVGHLYENRQSVVVADGRVQAIELPQGVESLIAPYRIMD